MDDAIASVRANPDALRSIQLKMAQGGLEQLTEADFGRAKALAKRSYPHAADWDAISLSDLRQASAQMRQLAATATPAEFATYAGQVGLTAAAVSQSEQTEQPGVGTQNVVVGAFVVGGAAILFGCACWSIACYANGDGWWC
jgi:hypothetical protein